MSDFKGTPGNFFAQSEELEDGNVSVCVCDQHGNSIAFCGRSLGLPERNAELFAAAPELLEAIQHIMEMQLRGFIVLGETATGKATSAINKALGQ